MRVVRYLVAIVAVGLLALRALVPSFHFDQVSLALFLVAAIALLLPDPKHWVVTRFQLGNMLSLELEKVRQQVQDLQTTAQAQGLPLAHLPPDVAERLAAAFRDPRTALVLVAIEIERAARELGRLRGIEGRSVREILVQLARAGAVPETVPSVVSDFWAVRNQIVHGLGFEAPPGQIYELVESGMRVLEVLLASLERQKRAK